MNVEDFVFPLPDDLIAAHPAPHRDESRLMVVPRDANTPIEHRHFRNLTEYLRAGDLLVMNDSRVFPARLIGHRPTGGRAELLLLHPCDETESTWRAFVKPAKKLPIGARVQIAPGFDAEVIGEHDAGERTLRFESERPFREALELHGQLPIPPYILRRRTLLGEANYSEEDRERYQTVYARHIGSIAAPTAGLHFTEELFGEIAKLGVETARVTLHVGAGTFQGMAEGGRVEEHRMHFEEYEISEDTAKAVTAAKRDGRRVIAVGTTSVRTLESGWNEECRRLEPGRARTDIMIKPGTAIRVPDAIVTNFHLPRSTLMLLVSAFTGRERILEAYRTAVEQRYRFFSYGDAMLLIP